MPPRSALCQGLQGYSWRVIFFSLFEMCLRMAVLVGLGTASAPSSQDVLPDRTASPPSPYLHSANDPSALLWMRAPALAGAGRGRAGDLGNALRR